MTTAALESIGAVRACVFVLGGERFAIPVRSAREVVVVDDLTIVPRTPSCLVGVTNLRGLILPIVDIRPLLGLASHPVGRGVRVVVVEAGSGQVGMAVDAVLGLTSLDAVAPFGEGARRPAGGVGVGVAKEGDGLVTLLDVAAILEALKR
jgi:purine-binding chemotaxis protein CheW